MIIKENKGLKDKIRRLLMQKRLILKLKPFGMKQIWSKIMQIK